MGHTQLPQPPPPPLFLYPETNQSETIAHTNNMYCPHYECIVGITTAALHQA